MLVCRLHLTDEDDSVCLYMIFSRFFSRFFQLIGFMYETKLKGHDGIAVYKSLHFSADFIGNFPEVGETHVDGGCHWRCYREKLTEVSCFLLRFS